MACLSQPPPASANSCTPSPRLVAAMLIPDGTKSLLDMLETGKLKFTGR